MVTIKNVNFSTFGNCLEISNGVVVLRVTTDLGPRIIYYGTTDEDNMMHTDDLGLNKRPSEFLDKNYKKGEVWKIYGGHRLWKSPEDEASYQPDHNKVDVTLFDNGAEFFSGNDKVTGIGKTIKVTMADNGDVTVEHAFYNCGDKPLNVALWALSVMNKYGTAVIPMSKEDTGLLANRNLVIWPYTDVEDDRLQIKQDYISMRQDPDCKGPMKIGTLNTEGIVYYIRGDKLVEKIFPKAKRDGNYADYSSSTELYTCKDFIEVESLSELQNIPIGGTATHTEIWKLHIADKLYSDIKALINEN